MSTTEDIEMSDVNITGEQVAEPSKDTDEVEPTPEQLATLEHVGESIPMSAWLIVFCEFCERFAFYGFSAPFQNYIQYPVPGPGDKQPGALNRGQSAATALTTFFRFFAYLTPMAGAVLADQTLGKYKSIIIGCCVYILGLLVLVLTSIPPAISSGVAFPGLIVAMIILAFGTGGVKSNVSPLMADQYTRTKPALKTIGGKLKIVDPKTTHQSMFNWFYWAINIGALSSLITTNIEKYHSFWLAYFIPMIVCSGTIIVLIVGRNKYIQKPPTGSLLVRAVRVTATAIRLRWKLGKQKGRQHLLDYAKEFRTETDSSGKQTVVEDENNKFIDDLKQAFKACRVFAFYPFYWVCYTQFLSNLVSQAGQMNVGPLPNDIFPNIDPLVLIVLIPVFDKVVYRTLRRHNIRFSSILRISVGFFFAALTMGWSALVQHLIYKTGPNYDFTKPCPNCPKYNDITVAWQVPAYVFLAISEIFASITGIEYAYTQAPASMKSIVMSLFHFTSALGNVLNFALVPLTVNPRLLWMYTGLTVLAVVMGVLFYLIFRNDDKPRDQTQAKK